MAVSRWCAAPEPEIWTSLGQDGEPDEDFPVDVHDRCRFERHKGHNHPCHRECCWGPAEVESRDCSCPCHACDNPWERWQVTLHDTPCRCARDRSPSSIVGQ